MKKQYKLDGLIANGRYGQIFLARDDNNKEFVIKQIDLISLTKDDKALIQKEVVINKQINSPYIVKFIDSYSEHGYLFILLEYCNSADLETHITLCIQEVRYFLQNDILKWTYHILQALSTLHERRIVHRDVKPENILLNRENSELVCKLADFGLSWQLNGPEDSCNSFTGSPIYMAPEIIGGKQYNHLVDIWSLGCVIVELCNLKQPFDHQELDEVMYHIQNDPVPSLVDNYTQDMTTLVTNMLIKDPTLRPEAKDLLQTKVFLKFRVKDRNLFSPIKAETKVSPVKGQMKSMLRSDSKQQLLQNDTNYLNNNGTEINDNNERINTICKVNVTNLQSNATSQEAGKGPAKVLPPSGHKSLVNTTQNPNNNEISNSGKTGQSNSNRNSNRNSNNTNSHNNNSRNNITTSNISSNHNSNNGNIVNNGNGGVSITNSSTGNNRNNNFTAYGTSVPGINHTQNIHNNNTNNHIPNSRGNTHIINHNNFITPMNNPNLMTNTVSPYKKVTFINNKQKLPSPVKTTKPEKTTTTNNMINPSYGPAGGSSNHTKGSSYTKIDKHKSYMPNGMNQKDKKNDTNINKPSPLPMLTELKHSSLSGQTGGRITNIEHAIENNTDIRQTGSAILPKNNNKSKHIISKTNILLKPKLATHSSGQKSIAKKVIIKSPSKKSISVTYSTQKRNKPPPLKSPLKKFPNGSSTRFLQKPSTGGPSRASLQATSRVTKKSSEPTKTKKITSAVRATLKTRSTSAASGRTITKKP